MRHAKKLGALVLLVALPLVAHAGIGCATRFDPPAIAAQGVMTSTSDRVTRARPFEGGAAWSTHHGVRVVSLAGTPEEIGAEHAALLADRMAEDEAVLWDGFARVVPFAPARAMLFDAARLEYRHVDEGIPEPRRRELAAQSSGFVHDPYASILPTYTRMVFLHSLYDISLGFERSPLLACTSFGLRAEDTRDGHVLFARAFDFEAADVFDRDKTVFVVREDGRIPFASVAWPGFVGVVTGMNAEGVAMVVHGGRAGDPSTRGVPVAFSLREALATAHDTPEAIAKLAAEPVMVSHIVFVGDAQGRFAVIERAPGVAAFVREGRAVTNHFEGPLAADPRDARVRRTTTTLARRARLDELLAAEPPASESVEGAVAILRDHAPAPGDRRAIDAFIATHGIVADLTARALWVSEGPHLSGKFVKIDVAAIVSRGEAAMDPDTLEEIPEDPALRDGRYAEGRARAGGPMLEPDAKKEAR